MNKIIEADLYRYGKLMNLSGLIKGIIKHQEFRYVYFLRKANKYKKYSLKGIITRRALHWMRIKFGFQVDLGVEIGEGFYIGHIGTIIIENGTTLGSNCNIAHNVSICQISVNGIKGYPTLGDKVWVGTGSVIVGKIMIGSNVLISPNTFINFDIPDNSIVIGNPAKVIHVDYDPTQGYINIVVLKTYVFY